MYTYVLDKSHYVMWRINRGITTIKIILLILQMTPDLNLEKGSQWLYLFIFFLLSSAHKNISFILAAVT